MTGDPIAEIEEWRPVPDHPGYEASSLGRMRSLDRMVIYSNGRKRLHPGVLMRPSLRGRYYCVHLGGDRGGIRNRMSLHVIICVTFHGKRPTKRHHTAHWNGDCFDNRARNLRWATPEENAADRVRHGHGYQGSQNGNAKFTEADVITIREMRRTTRLSLQAIAEQFGTDKGHIRRIVERVNWKHIP